MYASNEDSIRDESEVVGGYLQSWSANIKSGRRRRGGRVCIPTSQTQRGEVSATSQSPAGDGDGSWCV